MSKTDNIKGEYLDKNKAASFSTADRFLEGAIY
jgi:hypothetical protein